jgi:hypothetical protein
MDLNEECQQCIQLQKQNRLLRNQMIGNTQNLDKERATRIELQSSMKKLRVPYILNPKPQPRKPGYIFAGPPRMGGNWAMMPRYRGPRRQKKSKKLPCFTVPKGNFALNTQKSEGGPVYLYDVFCVFKNWECQKHQQHLL